MTLETDSASRIQPVQKYATRNYRRDWDTDALRGKPKAFGYLSGSRIIGKAPVLVRIASRQPRRFMAEQTTFQGESDSDAHGISSRIVAQPCIAT